MKPRRSSGRVARAAVGALLVLAAPVARATELACGAVVTSDVVLDGDLTCPESAIVIGADDVTVDLGGHTLVGAIPSGGDPRWSGVKTLRGISLRNIRVMNGAIVGFDRGIDARNVAGLTVQNLVVVDPLIGEGILVRNGAGVAIRNVVLRSGAIRPAFGFGILLDSVAAADVRNVTVRGFYYGLRFFCSQCTAPATPNSGSVRDSAFTHDYIGIALNAVADVTLAGNRMSAAGTPYGAGGGIGNEPYGPATNLRILDNVVTESIGGIFLSDVTASRIAGNVLLGNVYGGITLGGDTGSFGNELASNTALHNGMDVWADANSFTNTFTGNVCQTSVVPGVCSVPVP
jgi:parallel beta-helix repeat protein